MGFRLFFLRQGSAVKRILGVILAVTGISILLSTAPPWVWYAFLGVGLMGVGWFLFQHK